MICQRSGLCCVSMDVVIPVRVGAEVRALLKPGGKACPHLARNGANTTTCLVHEFPEYRGSPCWIYGNPDVDPDFEPKRGRPCAVGLHVHGEGGLHVLYPLLETAMVEDLKDLGPWPTKGPRQ